VGTKARICRFLVDLASEGRGILLISSEPIELVQPCDRIFIPREGRLVGEVPGRGGQLTLSMSWAR
jgi:ABC-type sugar transport system ATPase subunit